MEARAAREGEYDLVVGVWGGDVGEGGKHAEAEEDGASLRAFRAHLAMIYLR